MNACRSVCGLTLLMPARRVTLPTMRAAPCRSSRLPSARPSRFSRHAERRRCALAGNPGGYGPVLLRRDAVGLALVRSAAPGVSPTAACIGLTGVDALHE